MSGIQTSKNIEKIYKKYEEADTIPLEIASAVSGFHEAMNIVGAIYPAKDLATTNWSRPHWFYTLFTCVSHSLLEVSPLTADGAPKPDVNKHAEWRIALDEISALYDKYTEEVDEDVPASFAKFINFAQRRTTDTEARVERAKFVLNWVANVA